MMMMIMMMIKILISFSGFSTFVLPLKGRVDIFGGLSMCRMCVMKGAGL